MNDSRRRQRKGVFVILVIESSSEDEELTEEQRVEGQVVSKRREKIPIRNNVADKTDLATRVVFTRTYKSRTHP